MFHEQLTGCPLKLKPTSEMGKPEDIRQIT